MTVLDLVRPEHPSAATVLAALEQEYRAGYGALLEREHGVYHPDEFAPPRGAFVVIRRGEETMAGGALRRLTDGVGEIKRMWTAPQARGRGYARRVLAVLEATAIDYGYQTVRLETATPQLAAIALYRSVGYEPTESYGIFRDDPRFMYFDKRLS
jgi:ribosomal protein S18 acetylase RimI-like enzyme